MPRRIAGTGFHADIQHLRASYPDIGLVAAGIGASRMDVQKIPMSTGWYAANFVGAARP